MPYILSCCSTADLTEQEFASRDIHYICFHFNLNGKDMPDDLGKSISFPDFYQAMRDGASTSTSQVSVGEYEEYFEPFLKEGKDILHLTLSSGISGTYQSAMLARDSMQEKYPERKIIVIDSLAAACGYGLLMDRLADIRDSGATIDEAAAWVMEHRLNIHHWFYTGDLTYLVRGGRVSKAAGMMGKMLNICPLLNVSFEGKLVSRFKIRTKKKAMKACEEQMELHAENGLDYTGKVWVGHADCYDEAKEMADLISSRFPRAKAVNIGTVGTTIGSHTGPGLIVIAFEGDKRED